MTHLQAYTNMPLNSLPKLVDVLVLEYGLWTHINDIWYQAEEKAKEIYGPDVLVEFDSASHGLAHFNVYR